MRCFQVFAVSVVLFATAILAADNKADPAGEWKAKWEENGQKHELVFKVEVKDGKVTATVTAKGVGPTFDDGEFKENELTLSFTRTRGASKTTTKFKGKVDGDKFKGKVEVTTGKNTSEKYDFEAKRDK